MHREQVTKGKWKPMVQEISEGVRKPTAKVWVTQQVTRRVTLGDVYGMETHSRTQENPWECT